MDVRCGNWFRFRAVRGIGATLTIGKFVVDYSTLFVNPWHFGRV